MENRFKVVYTGELQPYVSAQEAIRNVAALFKVSEDRIRALVLGGQARNIKVDLDSVTAARYVSALSKAGLSVRVEPMTPPAADLHLAPAIRMEPVEEAPPEQGRCPKCGVAAVRDGVCGACGVVVAKYLARMNPAAEPDAGAAARADHGAASSARPYAPTSEPPPAARHRGAGTLRGPQGVPVGHGWDWIRRGFGHFTTSPGIWILIGIAYAFIVVVLSLVPLVGGIVASLISPVLAGGLMMGAHDQAGGKPLGFHHLFAGFSNRPGALVAAGALYLGGIVLAAIPAVLLLGGPMFLHMGGDMGDMGDMRGLGTMDPSAFGQDPQLMAGAMADAFAGRSFLLASLVAALFMVPVAMAYWFAPALIAVDGLGAWTAMKLSFLGCLKNILPFLLYGILVLILIVLGSLPFFLGLLVVMPTLVASMYVSYRDIFHHEA